jgi:hypothetical protein
MNRKNFNRGFNRIKAEKTQNAHAHNEFGCSSTPAPTPPVSSTDSRKAGVGAGLYNNQVDAGVGVRREEEVKMKGESQHRGKPPEPVGSETGFGRGVFHTFPRRVAPFGGPFYLIFIPGGKL